MPQLGSPVQESHLPVLGVPTVEQTVENLKSLSVVSLVESVAEAEVPLVLVTEEAATLYAEGLIPLLESVHPLSQYAVTEHLVSQAIAVICDKTGAKGSPQLVKKLLEMFPNPQGVMNLLT